VVTERTTPTRLVLAPATSLISEHTSAQRTRKSKQNVLAPPQALLLTAFLPEFLNDTIEYPFRTILDDGLDAGHLPIDDTDVPASLCLLPVIAKEKLSGEECAILREDNKLRTKGHCSNLSANIVGAMLIMS
jgi:hypothetical protein